jgi:hypothetical protein
MTAKAGIVEEAEMIIARQQYGKHVSAAVDTNATIEDAVFTMRPFVVTVRQTRFCSNESRRNNAGTVGINVFCVVRAQAI